MGPAWPLFPGSRTKPTASLYPWNFPTLFPMDCARPQIHFRPLETQSQSARPQNSIFEAFVSERGISDEEVLFVALPL